MSDRNEAARLLREALGIPAPVDRVPKALAARALAECFAGMSGGMVSRLDADIPRPPPAGSAIAELAAHIAGTTPASAPSNSDGVVSRKPSPELQAVIDAAVVKALAEKGVK